MGRKTTICNVALLAGVSVATVDRVLNGRGGVTPDKERRVLSAARRLGIDRALGRGYARTLRIAVLMQPASNPFHAALRDAFEAAGRAYADLNLRFLVHHLDPNQARRTAVAIAALGQRHDGLIVTSPADPLIAAALRRVAAGIPVVTLATDIPDCGRRAYVGPDDRQAGRVAGDLMGRFIGPSGGDIVMIAGLLAIAGHRDREAGFRTVLRDHHPTCRLAAVLESGEDAERAGQIALAVLADFPTLRGIYHASAGAAPVVAALRDRDRTDVVFITHELTDERRALLQDRAIDAVVDQNPAAEVRVAVETMARLLGRLDGEPTTTLTPIRIVMAENA